MSPLTIASLKEQTGATPLLATVVAQLHSRATRKTKADKPYLELTFSDSTGSFHIKVWSDSPLYQTAAELPESEVRRLEGKWTQGAFGIEVKDLAVQMPDDDSLDLFFAGDPGVRSRQDGDYEDISRFCGSIAEPRLHALCQRFLSQLGDRFRRTAAAKRNHHSRRGGLVEHVAQMMRSADAVAAVYPELNRDLLLAGVLFHDCGKLWENCYPERGFSQAAGLHGEMMGHIPLGIELVNKLWRDLMESSDASAWKGLSPADEDIRLHLLHLIGSHHGEHQFGSPVLPRTPEAFALHYIDNMDAKLEMLREAYAQSREISPGIFERVFPLPTNIVRPLPRFTAPQPAPEEDTPEFQSEG